MASETGIQDFLRYIERRGIPPKYHKLYRREAVQMLRHFKRGNLDQLTEEAVEKLVADEEKRVRNLRAVSVAMRQFIQHRRDAGVKQGPMGAPPTSSALLQPRGAQHRKYVRIPANRPVEVSGGMATSRISDISVGGVYIETMQTVPTGTILELRFRLRANDPEMLSARARVVFEDQGAGMGVDFVEPSRRFITRVQKHIEHYIATHGASAR